MSAFIGFGVVLAIAVVAAVLILKVVGGRRHRDAPRAGASQNEAAQSDDATGYVPGVWMLGGAESAPPGHEHPHGNDAGGTHAADAGGHSGGDGGGGH
jgi:hypothetical protein